MLGCHLVEYFEDFSFYFTRHFRPSRCDRLQKILPILEPFARVVRGAGGSFRYVKNYAISS